MTFLAFTTHPEIQNSPRGSKKYDEEFSVSDLCSSSHIAWNSIEPWLKTNPALVDKFKETIGVPITVANDKVRSYHEKNSTFIGLDIFTGEVFMKSPGMKWMSSDGKEPKSTLESIPVQLVRTEFEYRADLAASMSEKDFKILESHIGNEVSAYEHIIGKKPHNILISKNEVENLKTKLSIVPKSPYADAAVDVYGFRHPITEIGYTPELTWDTIGSDPKIVARIFERMGMQSILKPAIQDTKIWDAVKTIL